jgi:hypothetical protein
MGDEPTLLNPGERFVHLAWSTAVAIVVLGFCALFGLLRWCGDGVETCSDSALAARLAVEALGWAAGGGVVAGGVLALAPWSPRPRTRILTGIAVAIAALVATGVYLLL